jgi:excisionase family DNA binding protein
MANNMQSKEATRASQLIDIQEAARILGVPVRHVRRLVAERRVPFIKWGSRLHFDPVELEEWIDGHRIAPSHTSEAV